ncbi:Alg9-like mannosyltransferase family-domain-containing protein [Fennellomyces sp. T-0311]|nr:Alg9-like mannosyltransferase family-domain-containing protein [Fennellomyces sp. T-0311]
MINRRVIFYVVLLWLRWSISSSPGYIHPDEYFQSPEVTAGAVLDISTFTPWEFQPAHAARSVLVPFLTTGLPLWLVGRVPEFSDEALLQVPRAINMYFAERASSFLYSLAIDYAVYRMCRQVGQDPRLPIVLVSTSQVMMVYYMRPFSNTIESILLCLSLLAYTATLKQITSTLSFALGCLLSLGVFTRITFILYGFPVGVAYLWNTYKKRGCRFVTAAIPFLLGGTFVAIVCIFADSVFYKTLEVTFTGRPLETFVDVVGVLSDPAKWTRIRISGNLVLTPLNNILYNAKVENLQEHGLHPRYLHFLVNFPMLYGPLSAGALVAFFFKRGINSPLYYVLGSVVALAMAGLSVMPHQEARFLTPMLIPLAIMYTWNRTRLTRGFWLLWLVFNAIMTFIFGVLHQGGLVPAMIFLQQQSLGIEGCHVLENGGLGCQFGEIDNSRTTGHNVTTHLLFYKTYMPPRHLLGYPKSWENDSDRPNINVQDFGGQFEQLQKALENRAGVPFATHSPYMNFAPSKQTDGGFERTLLVAPSMSMLPKLENGRYLLIASFSPHVNFDDIQTLLDLLIQGKFSRALMSLNVYIVLTDED